MKRKIIKFLLPVLMIITLCALFAACSPEATKYTVTYVKGNASATGTAPTEADHAEGEKFTLAPNPFTLDGMVFDGWLYGETLLQPGAEFTMPSSNVTFRAKWSIDPANGEHSVTFIGGAEDVEGDASVYNDSYAPGEDVPMPTNPFVYERHVFTGWRVQGDTSKTYEPGDLFTMGSSDVIFEAVWRDAIALTVTFENGGATSGTVPAVIDTYEEASVQLPEKGDLVKTNYEFVGWKVQGSDERVYNAGATYKMGAANVTFEAVWEVEVKVSGVWTGQTLVGADSGRDNHGIGGGASSRSEYHYTVFLQEVTGGVIMLVENRIETVSEGQITQTRYSINGTRYMESKGGHSYAFDYVVAGDDEPDTITTYTLDLSASETNGVVSRQLVLSGNGKSLTESQYAEFDQDEQATLPTSGTYSYLYDSETAGETLYAITFTSTGANFRIASTDDRVGQMTPVNLVVFNNYIAVLGSSKEVLLVITEQKDGDTVTGYNIVDGPTGFEGHLMDTTEKDISEPDVPSGPADATLVGCWTESWTALNIVAKGNNGDITATMLDTSFEDERSVLWIVDFKRQVDGNYKSVAKVYQANGYYILDLIFDTTYHTLKLTATEILVDEDTQDTDTIEHSILFTDWASELHESATSSLSGAWADAGNNILLMAQYGSYVLADYSADGNPKSEQKTRILFAKDATDQTKYKQYDGTDYSFTVVDGVVTLTAHGADIPLKGFTGPFYGRLTTSAKQLYSYGKHVDGKAYTLTTVQLSDTLLYVAMNPASGVTGGVTFEGIFEPDGTGSGSAVTTWKDSTHNATYTMVSSEQKVKLTLNDGSAQTYEFYIITAKAINGTWTEENSEYKFKLEISEVSTNKMQKTVKITVGSEEPQTVTFENPQTSGQQYDGKFTLNGKTVKARISYQQGVLRMVVLGEGETNYATQGTEYIFVLYKSAVSST